MKVKLLILVVAFAALPVQIFIWQAFIRYWWDVFIVSQWAVEPLTVLQAITISAVLSFVKVSSRDAYEIVHPEIADRVAISRLTDAVVAPVVMHITFLIIKFIWF